MSGSCTAVFKYPAQNKRFVFRRIFNGKKQSDDVLEVWTYEIRIPKSRVLLQGYYVDTVGKNTTAIKEYIANQLERDKEMDQLVLFDPKDPFMGSK